MAFEIQIFVKYEKTTPEWKSVRPSRGDPYRFPTFEEAERNLRMCYPDLAGTSKARIVQVLDS